jgi:hypothetical protein
MQRRHKIRIGHSNGLIVAIGRDALDEYVELFSKWAKRHGAEPSLEYYAGGLEAARDDRAYARGFAARGDLDAYEQRSESRREAAKSQFQVGWRLEDPTDEAKAEARHLVREHLRAMRRAKGLCPKCAAALDRAESHDWSVTPHLVCECGWEEV